MLLNISLLRFVSFGSALVLIVSCASAPQKVKSEIGGNHSPVGETYYDGNRAPASMSPPFDMGPDKIALDPIYMRTKADYHFTIGETYSYEGDSARAIEEFKLTSIYDPSSALVRLKLAVEYVKKGLLSEGMAQSEEAIKIDPNFVEARLLLGGIYSAIKLYDRAEEQYKYILDHNKNSKEAYVYLGALYTEQKKYKEAIELFTKLSKDREYENPHMAHYYLARVYMEKGDNVKAETEFNKALSIKPDFAESVLALGSLYENDSKKSKSVKLYESYQDKHGPNEKVAEQLARLYLEEELYDKAYEQFEIVVAADPENLNAKVKMALILIEMKSYTRAITKLKEILAVAPDSDKIRFFLGAVYEEVKDYKAAIEQFSLLTASSSYYVEAVIHSSYLHKLMGDYSSAISVIEKGIEVRPEATQFYPLYASYLDDTKQYKKAVDMLEVAVKRFPENDQLYFFLGSMHDKTGNKPATLTSMKKAIEINPDHVQALNYLAYTYAEMEQNLDEAYNVASRALKLKPDDAYIQDTVGWVYFKRGNYSDAIRILESAHKLKSDESIIAEHLGDAYYMSRLLEKAKDMYRKAMKMETNEDTIRKLESKISAIEKGQGSGRMPASVSGR